MTNFAAGAYIAGNTIDGALLAINREYSQGHLATICPWDRLDDPRKIVFRRYTEALDTIIQTKKDSYLSIKASSLGYDREMIQALLKRAESANIRIHLDAMSPETADSTFSLVQELRPYYQNIGVTVPARWRRSIADAREMARLGLPIRVVKGQWSDGTMPDSKISRAFLEIIEMLSGKAPLIAVASHDSNLIQEALNIMHANGAAGELEQLYGLPCHCVRHARALNFPVRVYIPYGTAYLPYAVSQIQRNPKLGWWLTRDLIRSTIARCSGGSPH
jgi:proline dehydrogenase